MSLPDYTQLQEAYDKKLEDDLERYPVCDDCHHHNRRGFIHNQ